MEKGLVDSPLNSLFRVYVFLVADSTRVSENKVRTENNELIYMGVFPRRRASPHAARAPARSGVDQGFDHARFRLGWSSTALSDSHRVRPPQ